MASTGVYPAFKDSKRPPGNPTTNPIDIVNKVGKLNENKDIKSIYKITRDAVINKFNAKNNEQKMVDCVEYLNMIEAIREYFVKLMYIAELASKTDTKYNNLDELNADIKNLYEAANTAIGSNDINNIFYKVSDDIIPHLSKYAKDEVGAEGNIFDSFTDDMIDILVGNKGPSHLQILRAVIGDMGAKAFLEKYPLSLSMNYPSFYPKYPSAKALVTASIQVSSKEPEAAIPQPVTAIADKAAADEAARQAAEKAAADKAAADKAAAEKAAADEAARQAAEKAAADKAAADEAARQAAEKAAADKAAADEAARQAAEKAAADKAAADKAAADEAARQAAEKAAADKAAADKAAADKAAADKAAADKAAADKAAADKAAADKAAADKAAADKAAADKAAADKAAADEAAENARLADLAAQNAAAEKARVAAKGATIRPTNPQLLAFNPGQSARPRPFNTRKPQAEQNLEDELRGLNKRLEDKRKLKSGKVGGSRKRRKSTPKRRTAKK